MPPVVRRVVSLVPSLTEAVAATAPGLLVGATDWCTHPSELDVVRVRGTKNPDLDAVVALRPDLVLANAEENREPDLQALRERGVEVLVTDVRTVLGADPATAALGPGGQLEVMLRACGLDRPPWLDDADAAWGDLRQSPTGTGVPCANRTGTGDPCADPGEGRRVRVVVPIWRRPWMALGRDTFAGDVLRLLGYDNVLADGAVGEDDPSGGRYPRFDPADLPEHDLVVLPDEPYAFTADDGPEAFDGTPCALVSGRHLTWYGPSLVQARAVLTAQLGETLTRRSVS